MKKGTLVAVIAAGIAMGCSDAQTPAPAPAPTDQAAMEAPAPAAPEPPAPAEGSGPADGALSFPEGYTAWKRFLPSVDRPDAKQVRDIYLNAAAEGAAPGAPLPDGSVLVMEIYAAKLDASGNPEPGGDGRLQKGALSKIFVMEKNPGWGAGAAVPNGSWVYSAFEPDAKPATVDYATCRACHTPLADKDFVARLDEHLAQR